MHAHLPGGEDINGNVLLGNTLGTNNTGGDGFDGPPGPTDFQTTGIAIYSASPSTLTIHNNDPRQRDRDLVQHDRDHRRHHHNHFTTSQPRSCAAKSNLEVPARGHTDRGRGLVRAIIGIVAPLIEWRAEDTSG